MIYFAVQKDFNSIYKQGFNMFRHLSTINICDLKNRFIYFQLMSSLFNLNDKYCNMTLCYENVRKNTQ